MEDMDKYQRAIALSKVIADDEQVKKEVEELLAKHMDENRKKEVYEFMLNCIDLTTLSTEDSESSVTKFTEKVNDYDNNSTQYKSVAAICVCAHFPSVVRSSLYV